jgi:hypothetical protein
MTYRYRWIEAVPLRDGKDALNVNWLGVTITNETVKNHIGRSFRDQLAVDGGERGGNGGLRPGAPEDRE